MKDIKNYSSLKYNSSEYKEVAPFIYQTTHNLNDSPDCLALTEISAQENEIVKTLTGWKLYSPPFDNYEYISYQSTLYFRDPTTTSARIWKLKLEREIIFVTSLTFVQEPEFDEGTDSSIISQFPMELILDDYGCWVSDHYEYLNTGKSNICYLEFASYDLEDIKNLRTLIGKQVYFKEKPDGDLELVINQPKPNIIKRLLAKLKIT